jgi:hypothetical protein
MTSCLLKYQHIIDNVEKKYVNSILELKENLSKINNENQKLKDYTIELETEIRLLREQNERSTSTVEEIAKQPRVTSTTNNNQKVLINTPMDMSSQTLNQVIQDGFSDEYLTQGQKGVARFAVENILKDEQGKLKYICTDAARQIFQYKNKDGSIQRDVRAVKLTKALLEAEIKQTSHKIAWDKMEDAGDEVFMAYTNYYQNIQGMEQDNSEFSKELSCLTV